jgi:hypothetical protein
VLRVGTGEHADLEGLGVLAGILRGSGVIVEMTRKIIRRSLGRTISSSALEVSGSGGSAMELLDLGFAWYHSQSQDDETGGASRSGPEHYCRAEELAAEAYRLPGQGDGQATAGAWAAVAQAHAVLALAAATAIGASGADHRAWADAAGTGFGSGRGDR